MNFLKTMFAVLFAHRVMSVIITIVLGFILFYILSDLDFMEKVFDGTMAWINENASAMGTWATNAVNRILNRVNN